MTTLTAHIASAEKRDAAAPEPTYTVADIPDEELLRRAVECVWSSLYNKGRWHPRWVAVMEIFAPDPDLAEQLCQRFGFDPHEMVKR